MSRRYHKSDDGRPLGQEDSHDFPAGDGDENSCGSGIVISYGVQVYEPFRGQGHGKRLHMERLTRWTQEGYNYALCTVRRDNETQLKILRKAGWTRLANTASLDGTPIYIMGRNLK